MLLSKVVIQVHGVDVDIPGVDGLHGGDELPCRFGVGLLTVGDQDHALDDSFAEEVGGKGHGT